MARETNVTQVERSISSERIHELVGEVEEVKTMNTKKKNKLLKTFIWSEFGVNWI